MADRDEVVGFSRPDAEALLLTIGGSQVITPRQLPRGGGTLSQQQTGIAVLSSQLGPYLGTGTNVPVVTAALYELALANPSDPNSMRLTSSFTLIQVYNVTTITFPTGALVQWKTDKNGRKVVDTYACNGVPNETVGSTSATQDPLSSGKSGDLGITLDV